MSDPSTTHQIGKRLEGKVALVTGAGQGIGEAISRLFAAEGAIVVLSARSEDKLRHVADEISQQGGIACAIPADIAAVQSIEALVNGALERFHCIDILVHNAGI